MPNKYTKEEFLKKAIEIHGDKIDFSNFEYINSLTSSFCKCNKCGKIWSARADVILRGCGCPSCSKGNYQKLSFEDVSKKIINTILLNKDTYIDTKHKCEATCIICGHKWFPRINDLINGHGCPECARQNSIKKANKAINDLIINNINFDFTESIYLGCRKKVTATCKKCGEMLTRNYNTWLQGKIKCHCDEAYKKSKLEQIVEFNLNFKNIRYVRNDRKTLNGLELDFLIPSKNIAIECQGEQHFRPKSFGCHDEQLVKENFEKQIERDNRKKELCKENGIELVYFLDKEYNKYLMESDIFFNDVDELVSYLISK